MRPIIHSLRIKMYNLSGPLVLSGSLSFLCKNNTSLHFFVGAAESVVDLDIGRWRRPI